MRLKFPGGEMTLRHTVRDIDRYGQERLYVRVKGKLKVRLLHQAGTAAFLQEYEAALGTIRSAPRLGEKAIAPGSFRWLAVEYMKSPVFAAYDPATKRIKRGHIDKLCVTHGENPIKQLKRKHIQKIVDDRAETPFEANNYLKTLSPMFKWAIKREYLDSNPCRDVERIKTSKEGHHTWTAKEMRIFLTRHPLTTKAGLAFVIFYFTGARKSDVVTFGRQMETDAGSLRWREKKGGEVKTTEIPISDEFRVILDVHHSKDRLHYLMTSFGKPFTANGFGNWFRDRCDEAGLKHCSAHGIRKGSATIAAEEGANSFDLMSFFNWASLKDAEHYTKRVERTRLAANTSKLLTLKNIQGSKVSNSDG